MIKFNKIFILLIFVFLSVFFITGCDFLLNSNTITFSLDKINSESFTLTVKNANWTEIRQGIGIYYYSYGFDVDIQLTDINGVLVSAKKDYMFNTYVISYFELVLTSPTVITLTLVPEYVSITGTISLNNKGVDTYYPVLTDGGSKRDFDYIVDSKKSSITF